MSIFCTKIDDQEKMKFKDGGGQACQTSGKIEAESF